MVLDLVAEDLGVPRSLLDHGGREVAHPHVPYAPFLLELSHGAKGLLEGYAWIGPVHEEKVDVLGPEILEALAGRADDAIVGEAARPYLGDEEDLLAVHTRVSYGAPDPVLVGVYLGGVDVAVSQGEGVRDGPDAPLAGEPPGTQAQRRNLHPFDSLVLQVSFLSPRDTLLTVTLRVRHR